MHILLRLGLDVHKLVFARSEDDLFATALSIHTQGGKYLGVMGIVDNRQLKKADIEADVYYADLLWDELLKAVRSVQVNFKELPKYPMVKRDLALLLDKDVAFADVEKTAYETEKKLLRKVELFDVYEGKNLEAGKKSYAVSFFLQDESQTLTEKQIDKIMGKLVANLESKLGAKLR